jgi:hypothetical protein
MTVVETPTFSRDAERVMTQREVWSLINFLARHPEAGVVIAGTGGVRKLRWALKGKGRRGGARVIYYFCNETLPLFLLNEYAKNEKVNLTEAERNEIRKLVPRLIANYRGRMRS